MTTCPRCGSIVLREPAALRCLSRGARLDLLDEPDDARLAQRLLDHRLRPRSYECWPEAVNYIPRRPGLPGWLKLPGEPVPKRR